MTTPEPTPLREALNEKRCRICRQAHWRAPEGWIADHTSEPVDMSLATPPAALDVERLARALGVAWPHLMSAVGNTPAGLTRHAEVVAAAYQQEGK